MFQKLFLKSAFFEGFDGKQCIKMQICTKNDAFLTSVCCVLCLEIPVAKKRCLLVEKGCILGGRQGLQKVACALKTGC